MYHDIMENEFSKFETMFNLCMLAQDYHDVSTINHLKLASDILIVKDIIKNNSTNSFIKNNRINFFASI